MSGYDTSHTASVKRNLSKSFGNNGSISKPQRALFDSNRSLKDNENVVKGRNCDERRKSLINIIPVVQNNKKRIEVCFLFFNTSKKFLKFLIGILDKRTIISTSQDIFGMFKTK